MVETQGPRLQDLTRCVHCGLCAQSCPTYVETGLETESPRGRLYLMRARAEGRIEATENFRSHIDLCLLCRNCEAVCPSGVPYGRIMQAERAQVLAQRRQPVSERALRWLVFRWLLPRPARMKPLAAVLRLYRRSGLPGLLRGTGLLRLLPRRLRQMEAMLPPLSRDFFGLLPAVVPASGVARGRVGLFGGCVMPLLFGDVNAATARVLARNGYEVVVVSGATCCGSLHEHSGELETARELARRNIGSFLNQGFDAIIVNAAGCGATLKEYGELLAGDPAWADRARAFSGLVRDVSEFLAEVELHAPMGEVPLRITYQDSCHLAHAQRITRQPRDVLGSVPGLDLVEMRASDQCCGSAGVYNVVKADFSQRLLAAKMENVAATGAQVVVTANPGCMLQLALGMQQAGVSGRVAHVVEVLDWAYQATAAGDQERTTNRGNHG